MVTKKAAVKKPIKKAVKKTAKTVARKAPVVKKAVRKTPTAKKTVRKAVSRKKAVPMRSFHIHRDPEPFTSFRVTRQTVYWAILLGFIVVTQLWILSIQIDIANLTTALLAE